MDWHHAETLRNALTAVAHQCQARANDIRIWERRIDDAEAERDQYRRNAPFAERTRAEAAEAKVQALESELATFKAQAERVCGFDGNLRPCPHHDPWR